jgi:predicted dehydrogenase
MSQSINRRAFFGRTALGAAGIAAGVSTAGAQESATSRVVIGVMGMSRGRSLATQFASLPNVEVRYTCDVDSNRAAKGAEAVEKGGAKRPQAITDFRRILEDPEVDALVCAAPNHWHAPATILACAAGKHVYCEKPCSHNPREAELMVEAARKHKRAVQVGTQRRSSVSIREAIEMIHGGKIGRVYSARATFSSKRASIGTGKPADVPSNLDYDLWQGPAPRKPWMSNRVHYNWHWFWHWGNGEIGNNGVHLLDVCRWGMGVDFPVHVASAGGRYAFQDDQETPDTLNTAFAFEGDKLITWQGQSCNPYGPDFVNFHGEKGSLLVADNGGYRLLDLDNKELRRRDQANRGDIEHIEDFLAAIREDRTTGLNCGIEDAYQSTTLCHLGNIAQRLGRSLRCDGSNGHILDDPEAMAMWSRKYEPGWEPVV